MGDIHRKAGDREAALGAYERVAQAYAREGFLVKAIAVCKVILTVDPRHTETQELLADLYAQKREPKSAPTAPESFGGKIPESSSSFVRAEDLRGSAGLPSAAPAAARNIPVPAAQTWIGRIQLDRSQPSTAPSQPAVHAGANSKKPDLPHIPLFSELPRAAFIEVLVRMKRRELTPGQVLIREGQPGDSFFIVSHGQVRVTRQNDRGQAVLLARLRDGAFFGEMAVLQPGPRTASVTAEAETEVLEVTKDVLDGLIDRFPSVENVLRDFHRQRLLATCMATHPLFQPFSLPERRSLMERFKMRAFERGEVLIREGQPPSGLYLVLHGRLLVTRQIDRAEIQLAELNAGSMFGEMSLLSNEPTSATVLATTDCLVLRLSKSNFREVMMTHPQILEQVSELSEQRREANQVLLDFQISPHAAILV
ncbi:MAG: cyclic nucleotide-binding domain-containing protein [Myxococcales bacterium]|nr:cyclic nucleotide-binding domain-containing protein [Myxococcales bacterium]